MEVFLQKNNGEKKLNEIDTLSKYYFDRTFDNYKIAMNPDFISNNYVYNDIKSRLKEWILRLANLIKFSD